MELYWQGLLLGLSTFLIIGIFHPIVIKTEYYTGTRYWWVFLLLGMVCAGGALFIEKRFLERHSGHCRLFVVLDHP